MEGIRSISLGVGGLTFDGLAAGPKTGELVVLLHGFPQFADSWVEVMRQLAGAGLRVVAMNQRGYSAGARPMGEKEYEVGRLVGDVLGFAEALGATAFHVVGHDWGGLVAWELAARHPERLKTLCVLATPHPSAFRHALVSDIDQMNRSKYILLFRAPGHVAEKMLLANGGERLRGVYQGFVPVAQVDGNVRRFSEDGALTAALNWYRALSVTGKTGRIAVPTLYVWGDQDIALGQAAALATTGYVDGPYRFERMTGRSHWLVDEVPDEIAAMLLEHLGS